MISLKFSCHELEAFGLICWNDAAILMKQEDSLWRLAGIVIHELHHRLNKRTSIPYFGDRSVTLNHKECLALHESLSFLQPQTGGDFYSTVRYKVFEAIDKKINNGIVEGSINISRV